MQKKPGKPGILLAAQPAAQNGSTDNFSFPTQPGNRAAASWRAAQPFGARNQRPIGRRFITFRERLLTDGFLVRVQAEEPLYSVSARRARSPQPIDQQRAPNGSPVRYKKTHIPQCS